MSKQDNLKRPMLWNLNVFLNTFVKEQNQLILLFYWNGLNTFRSWRKSVSLEATALKYLICKLRGFQNGAILNASIVQKVIQEVLAIRGGNGNSRITKPRISRSPIFGSPCPLTLYYFRFIMLIGNYLSIPCEKVAIF